MGKRAFNEFINFLKATSMTHHKHCFGKSQKEKTTTALCPASG
jgi:hypothetical protein